MTTTTSNVGVFDRRFYESLNQIAANYMMENPGTGWIPQAVVQPMDASIYKKPIYGESIGVKGAQKLSRPALTMETPSSTQSYDLSYVEGDMYYDVNDMAMEQQYLVQRKAQELRTWTQQVSQSIFKGVFTNGFVSNVGQGVRLNDGIIEQSTLVENLDGTNSQLTAAGDVYKALSKMLGSIPFRYRDGRQVIVGVDDLFVRKARSVTFRGATNQISELDLFLQEQTGGMAQQGNELASTKLIVSDSLFLNTKAGTTKTETDTSGTHSRIFMAVVDPSIIEQAYSRFGLVGEDRVGTVQGLVQKFAARCSGCVHQPEAVVYSEQITWA